MSFWGRYWWAICFCLCVGFIHLHFIKEKKGAISHLTLKLEELERQKWECLQRKEDLELRIASQTDPIWIEMILMRDLGVVPEGFLKVHFKR
jgi:hypothetical protein